MKDHMISCATREESDAGATAVEYAVMVALIAIVIVASVEAIGDSLIGIYADFAGRMGWS